MIHLHSSPAHPLDVDDLLQEILLRLPPQPSSLPRASAVCKHWCSMLSDPRFICRFRKHHRKPRLLGFFAGMVLTGKSVFVPVLESPNRIPSTCFSVRESHSPDESWIFTGCRHGLTVLVHQPRREIAVWDPLTGQQHLVTFPASLDYKQVGNCQAEVLCADADDGHVHGNCFLSPFKLVLICTRYAQTFVSLYNTGSSVWGNTLSIATTVTLSMVIPSILARPSILVRNALYWSTSAGDILVYDIERQTIGMIEMPEDNRVTDYWRFHLLRMEDGRLGLAVLSELTIQLWERKSDSDGVPGWVLLQKTISLEEMLPRGFCSDNRMVIFVGYDEDTNVIVLRTMIGNFMLQLDKMEIRIIIKRENKCDAFYPYHQFLYRRQKS